MADSQVKDSLVIGGHEFTSRFILGSGKYSLKLIEAAVRDAGAQIVTLAVRRQTLGIACLVPQAWQRR